MSEVRIEGNIEHESSSTTLIDPKTVVVPYSNPKVRPLGPKKVKNDPKIKSKSKVWIERNIENESCSNTLVEPKTVIEPYSNPKIAHKGPKKSKMTPKLSRNQMSELKVT